MANILGPKYSNTPSAVPTTGNLVDGEFAINSSDKIVYLRVGGDIIAVANYSAGTGDIVGPSSSIDNGIPRFDGTTGKLLQGIANTAILDTGYVGFGTHLPANPFQASPLVTATGTASLSSATVTGSGTSFTAGMVGDTITFANGVRRTITGYTSATQLTVSPVGTVSSQAFTINKTGLNVDSSGNVAIGAITPASPSRFYVYGGVNGANIDVRGNANQADQAILELQGSDYEDVGPNSIFFAYYGADGIGTTMGFDNDHLGILLFQETLTSIIATSNATPLIFGIDYAEKMRLDGSGRLLLGTTSGTAKAHIRSTTEQLRLEYDGSNYTSITVGSDGATTFNAVGGGAFVFSDAISATNLSGTNTGDNATNTQYSGLAASKQDTLVSGTNIKTINSASILGSGNLSVGGASEELAIAYAVALG